jgi:Tol biopolymer transport system component
MFWKRKTISLVLALALIASVANADYTFGTPVNLGPVVNSSSVDAVPSPSADGLSLYFNSDRSGGYGDQDLWVTTRTAVSDPWDPPVNLGPTVNTSSDEGTASISADGLELYFISERSGGFGSNDLWMTTRATKDAPWGEPVNLGPTVNSSSIEFGCTISSDGLDLYFGSDRPGGYGDDIWVTRRETTSDDWGSPVNLGPTVNSWSIDATPSISADGLLLFFQSDRAGGYGGVLDIWVTRRATKDDPWEEPTNLGPIVNSSSWEGNPGISADGSTFYFVTNRSGGSGNLDIWQATVEPIVDLNEDGIVDCLDMCIIVDNWGTDEPLCDIGPMPWGDGVVDVNDLIVLAEHLFEGRGVIERRISVGSDDAEEALNAGYSNWNDSSDLEIVDDHIDNGGRQLIGLTFRDIDIPPGEVISHAYVEFVCDETINGTDDAYFLIWGHLTPNSEGFVEPFVISNRPKTAAMVPWEPDTWNAGGQKIQTVNIAPIIQELIDQEDWVAGNAVEIIIGADPDKPAFTGVRVAESHEGSLSSAPLLHIEIAVP